MTSRLICLELNEVNFEFVERYVRQGHLPAMGRLLAKHGLRRTTSETRYEELEPWIQWVTAHTGLRLAEHGVFRLGDIVQKDLRQVWEILEAAGVSVGAISPMNASNRCVRPHFFVPDPWTQSAVSGGALLTRLHAALAQVVSDNAHGKVDLQSAFWLVLALCRYTRRRSMANLLAWIAEVRKAPFLKAMILDRLLADIFISLWGRHQPQYSTLFLNAAAHIQHHYMYASEVYEGPHRNPEWYLSAGRDPLLEVYGLYDRIVADVMASAPGSRVVIATALHQDPCTAPVYYYRLRDHHSFLKQCGIEALAVRPLMSRDFTFECRNSASCMEASRKLQSLVAPDGVPMFFAEVRETSVFAMLTYPKEISSPFPVVTSDGGQIEMSREVSFVALKNGVHNGVGYVVDTNDSSAEAAADAPLSSLLQLVLGHFGLSPNPRTQ
jgi:hypothetical protein